MQQTTINLPGTNPVRALTGLARQIALPAEHKPERFPSFPALERTAVMGFTYPSTLQLTTGTRAFLARQAAYPLWADMLLPTGEYYSVSYGLNGPRPIGAIAANTSITLDFRPAQLWRAFNGNYNGDNFIPLCASANNSQYLKYPLLGIDNALTDFIYVPNYWAASIAFTADAPFTIDTAVSIVFERWTSPGNTDTFSVQVSIAAGNRGGGLGFNNNPQAQWIRPVEVYESTGAAGTNMPVCNYNVSVSVSNCLLTYAPSASNAGTNTLGALIGNISMLPLVSPTDFATTSVPWLDTRVTAVGALFTNVTQVLSKNGTVLCGRLNPNVKNVWNFVTSDLNGLHPAEKAFLPLETGMYTYAPPSTDMADFWNFSTTLAGVGTISSAFLATTFIPTFALSHTALINCAIFTPVSGTTETLAVSASVHFEFRTSSSLFQIALSGLSLETLHAAQLSLAAAGFFFENPTHKKVLDRVVSAVKTVAPHLINAAVSAFPAARPLVRAVKSIMVPVRELKPTQTMKPTDAVASGIVKPKPAGKKKKVVVVKKKKIRVRK